MTTEEIKSRTQEWIAYFKAGKTDELADDLYSSDCKMFIVNQPLACGREGIKQELKGMTNLGITEVDIQSKELLNAGEYAIDRGVYVMKGSNGEVLEQGNAVMIWKSEGGKWRICMDCPVAGPK